MRFELIKREFKVVSPIRNEWMAPFAPIVDAMTGISRWALLISIIVNSVHPVAALDRRLPGDARHTLSGSPCR